MNYFISSVLTFIHEHHVQVTWEQVLDPLTQTPCMFLTLTLPCQKCTFSKIPLEFPPMGSGDTSPVAVYFVSPLKFDCVLYPIKLDQKQSDGMNTYPPNYFFSSSQASSKSVPVISHAPCQACPEARLWGTHPTASSQLRTDDMNHTGPW